MQAARDINALERVVKIYGVLNTSFGSYGTGDGQFSSPIACIIHNSEIYVSDNGNTRIQVFSMIGTFARKWTTTYPGCLGMTQYAGEIFVIEGVTTPKLCRYTTSGSLVTSWTIPPYLSGNEAPWGVAVYNDEVYISSDDTYFHSRLTVQVFTLDGTFVRGWYESSGGATYAAVFGIAVLNNEVYVSRYSAPPSSVGKISVYSTSGTPIRSWTIGNGGVGAGDLRVYNELLYHGGATGPSRAIQCYLPDGTDKGGVGLIAQGYYGVDRNATQLVSVSFQANAVYVFDETVNISQTEFQEYLSATTKTSLGTPDGGVSVPALDALDGNGFLAARQLTDLRVAIQALAPYYKNAVTGNAFNWTASSADNLYYVALGNRTKYGATGGAAYDWTRSEAQLENSLLYDLDIGEARECIDKLQASALV